jgi:threonine dehydratase
MVDLASILRARESFADAIVDTPCLPSKTLSAALGVDITLKFENLQFTGSFKERGALNKLLSMPDAEKAAGVVAVSAGNHAQGVAYHARRLGIQATIVMPATAPPIKVSRVREFGAEVILHGLTFADATSYVPGLVSERGLTPIHPFDDFKVIEGQGTIAVEMLRSVPDLDVIVVPIGGGGMIAGMATAAKAIKPSIRVVGVQSEQYPGMLTALGRRGPGPGGQSIAEGIAVAQAGTHTKVIIEKLVDDILVVSDDDIEDAIVALLEIEKVLCEGAGATGIAALTKYPGVFDKCKAGVVLSGGNLDMSILSGVLQRVLVRKGLVARLAIEMPDFAGSLGRTAATIARAGGNIRHVTHDRVFSNSNARSTNVIFEVELQKAADMDAIVAGLVASGMEPHCIKVQ